MLLSMTQFHIPYYAGRTLPNFMALPWGKSYPTLARSAQTHTRRDDTTYATESCSCSGRGAMLGSGEGRPS